MATMKVEVYKTRQRAEERKLQLEIKGFSVSGPDAATEINWNALDVTGREDIAPDSDQVVWVIHAQKN